MRAFQYLPNAITLARLLSVPALVWLIAGLNLAPAFWLFVGAGITDALDGALARIAHAQSALGSYLDALADKVMLVGVYCSLGFIGLLGEWLVGLVVVRDVFLVCCATGMTLAGHQTQVIPLLISKVNTLFQILLAAVAIGHHGMGWFSVALVPPLSVIVAVTTVLSGIAYVIAWWPAAWTPRGRRD